LISERSVFNLQHSMRPRSEREWDRETGEEARGNAGRTLGAAGTIRTHYVSLVLQNQTDSSPGTVLLVNWRIRDEVRVLSECPSQQGGKYQNDAERMQRGSLSSLWLGVGFLTARLRLVAFVLGQRVSLSAKEHSPHCINSQLCLPVSYFFIIPQWLRERLKGINSEVQFLNVLSPTLSLRALLFGTGLVSKLRLDLPFE